MPAPDKHVTENAVIFRGVVWGLDPLLGSFLGYRHLELGLGRPKLPDLARLLCDGPLGCCLRPALADVQHRGKLERRRTSFLLVVGCRYACFWTTLLAYMYI